MSQREDMDRDWEITVTVPLSLPGEQREALFSAVADTVAKWEPEDREGWDAMVSAHPETFSLLLWLHAEAVWLAAHRLEVGDRLAWRLVEAEQRLASVEASRRDWAAEADRLESLGPDKNKILGLVNAVLRGNVYTIVDYMDSDGEPMKVVPAEDIDRVVSEVGRRWEAPAFRPHKAPVPAGEDAPCACLTEQQAKRLSRQRGWSLPLCAVHPEADRAGEVDRG